MATLKENMEAIKLEKDTKILPENLKKRDNRFWGRRYAGRWRNTS